jgi:hypothetical protein
MTTKQSNSAKADNASPETKSVPPLVDNAARIKELEAKWDGIRPDDSNKAELEKDRKEYAELKAKAKGAV